MAPMEHVEIRQSSLGDVIRGAEVESILRRRSNKNTRVEVNKRGGGGGGGDDLNPSDARGEGKSNTDGGKKANGSSPTDNSNNKNNDPPPTPPLPTYLPLPAPVTVATASPTTIWVISNTTATAAPSTSYTSFISSSTTSVTTLVSESTSSSISTPTVTVYTSFPTSTSPRKGLNTDGDDYPSSTTSSSYSSTPFSTFISTTMIPASSLLAATALVLPETADSSKSSHHSKGDGKNGDLSLLAEYLLIAAGAIGAFIMVAAAIWFLARIRKIDLLSPARNRKIERGGPRGWYGWRKQHADYTSDPPPQYSRQEFPADEKVFSNQKPRNAYYTPLALPPPLAHVNSQHQELVREALVQNVAPFAPLQQTFHNPVHQNSSSLTRQGTQMTQVSAAHSGYNNAGTQNTIQTSGAYDPNQREVNHLSYLSSLSSGFGDGLIIPEPTVVGVGDPRESYRNTRKFSWMTSNTSRGPVGDRDTVYTNASIESVPRFRTINSWVAQQSGRVGQVQSDQEAPSMPAIPLPLQGSTGVVQRRNTSEDPAFRHHPGDEIEIGRGSRVPSSILDKKFMVNLG